MEFLTTIARLLEKPVVALAIGIIASFVASMMHAKWKTKRRWKEYRSLLGVWVQANESLADRPFSVAEFLSLSNGELQFKGCSYNNSGEEYYEWWSIVLHIDDLKRRMSYVYETQKLNDRDKDEGFGCIVLHQDPGTRRWNAQRGYFLDLKEARPRNTRMVRFEKVAAHFQRKLNPASRRDRRSLVNELINNATDAGVRELFRW